MRNRVYLSIDISVIPEQEDTPVSIRMQVSSATVKALHTKLQQAYRKDDRRLVRRPTVLIDMLVHQDPSRCCASAGASVPPVSTTGSGPFSSTAWAACSTVIAVVVVQN